MERRAGTAAIRRPSAFGAGRSVTSQQPSATPSHLTRHGSRFILFSVIGGGVFLAGLGLQAILTGTEETLFESLRGRWVGVRVGASQLTITEG